jgi:hypothetical protein
MKKTVISVILLSILIVNCKNKDANSNSRSTSEVEDIAILDTLELKLDHGQKWMANVETHEGVKHIDSLISVFKSTEKTDYKVLGDALSKETGYIIKNCSMKGEPHDQLHVVLVPMLDEISILRDTANTKESEVALERLEQLVARYFEYFKV